MHKKLLTSILIIFALAIICFGQESKNDAVQDHTDFTYTPPEFLANGYVNEILRLASGKALVRGSFDQVNREKKREIFRLNQDGTVDQNFFPEFSIPVNYIDYSDLITETPDGKLYVFISQEIKRYNSDGSFDTTFRPFRPTGGLNRILAQSDGKVWYSSNSEIARLNADGSFDLGIKLRLSFCRLLGLNSDGKMYFSGSNYISANDSTTYIVRLNANGSIDTGFNFSSRTGGGIGILSNGKILIRDGNEYKRLNSDGSIDITFLPKRMSVISDFQLLANGDLLVVAPHSDNQRPGVFILKDNLRRPIQLSLNDFETVDKISLEQNGKFVVAGDVYSTSQKTPGYAILRYNADATLAGNASIKIRSNENTIVRKIVSAPDGKIIAIGNFNFVGGKAHNYIVRLNYDGSIDETFNAEIESEEKNYLTQFRSHYRYIGKTVTVQPDGKVLINFLRKLLRYNLDGSLDRNFESKRFCGNGFCFEDVWNIISLKEDNKILVTGNFDRIYNDNNDLFTRRNLAILNFDGTMTSYNPPKQDALYGIRSYQQPDDKILIMGMFNDIGFNPPRRSNFFRLSQTGEPETNVTINHSYEMYNNFAVTRDNKIIVPDFAKLPVRYNMNGGLDRTFRPSLIPLPVGFSGFSETEFYPQNNGKLLISGKGYFNQSAILDLEPFRLNENGSLDDSFNPNILRERSDTINSFAGQFDGKYLFSGKFTQDDGSVKFLTRLNP